MAITDYSTTAASNTTVGGVGIQGTNVASNMDNAVRAIMADIATALAAGTFSATGYVAKSSTYTVLTTDRGKLIDCTAALELDLPAAATAGAAFMFWVKANGGAVTIDPNGSENINGSSTSLVVADGQTIFVVCTGSAWHTGSVNTYVTLTGTQTLTNKTLTAAILGGTTNLSGGQITFPASQSASADANTLDDYEEGTWTPAFAAAGGTFSYSSQTGHYIKIGKLVWISFDIRLNTSGNTLPAAALTITGAPFTFGNFNTPGGANNVAWDASSTSFINIYLLPNANATTVAISGNTAADTSNIGALNANAVLHATNGSRVAGMIVYEATA